MNKIVIAKLNNGKNFLFSSIYGLIKSVMKNINGQLNSKKFNCPTMYFITAKASSFLGGVFCYNSINKDERSGLLVLQNKKSIRSNFKVCWGAFAKAGKKAVRLASLPSEKHLNVSLLLVA